MVEYSRTPLTKNSASKRTAPSIRLVRRRTFDRFSTAGARTDIVHVYSKVATTVTEDVTREVALPLGFVDVKVW
jgi:hypothetical protein